MPRAYFAGSTSDVCAREPLVDGSPDYAGSNAHLFPCGTATLIDR
jgi:hypothetical protein